MSQLDREIKRNRKIARAMIRLKHSLLADDEIWDWLEAERDALKSGEVLRLEPTLKDLQDAVS